MGVCLCRNCAVLMLCKRIVTSVVIDGVFPSAALTSLIVEMSPAPSYPQRKDTEAGEMCVK